MLTLTWQVTAWAPLAGPPVVVPTVCFQVFYHAVWAYVFARFPTVMLSPVAFPSYQKLLFCAAFWATGVQDFIHKVFIFPLAPACMAPHPSLVVEDSRAADIWALEFANTFRLCIGCLCHRSLLTDMHPFGLRDTYHHVCVLLRTLRYRRHSA